MLVGVSGGVPIPSGLPWATNGAVYTDSAGYGAVLPEGMATYLGVRMDLGGGWQYAWVGGARNGLEFEPFAWGYETEVGVPIAAGAPTIPEPGTLALLAVGAVGLAGRRSRRQRHDN